MTINKVCICGVNTSKLPLLKDEEKEELFVRMDHGDMKAREIFIQGNLRLVLSVIQKFVMNNREVADDLFQVGCIGLIKAIDNFDRSLEVKFSTYAVPMIIGECRRYLRDNSSIRVSRSLRDIAYKTIYTKETLMKKLNREPTIEEISVEIDIPKEDIINAMDAIATPMSLFEPIFQDGPDVLCLGDQISDKKNREDRWVNKIAVSDAMSRLSKKEQTIIELRFFSGKTQMEVSRMLNISQAQVSRLEKDAIKQMRNYLR